ncbi:MAG: hypothetical protein K0Q55_3139, partial [Verrucomicrobia bacterium]|nr:hypothetical protein [Verrucomicrobiota bacterium]
RQIRQPPFLRKLQRIRPRLIKRFSVEHHMRAELTALRHLHLGSIARHHDSHRYAQLPAMPRQPERMIACGSRDHSAPRLITRQQAQRTARPTLLETPSVSDMFWAFVVFMGFRKTKSPERILSGLRVKSYVCASLPLPRGGGNNHDPGDHNRIGRVRTHQRPKVRRNALFVKGGGNVSSFLFLVSS